MYKVRGTIWIEGPGGTFLGVGRMELLQKIAETGSISEAARKIKMSYRQAWELVDAMNRESKKPLVLTSSGGVGGGGTYVTDEGKKAIRTLKRLHAKFFKFTEKETLKLDI